MRRLTIAVAAAVATLATPPLAHAHGIQGRADLPVPLTAFYWAAAAVLVVSFVVLGVGWRQPLLARRARAAAMPPTRARGRGAWFAGFVTFGVLLLVLTAALGGSQEPNDNIAPILVFVVWWIGIALCAGFIGDLWRIAHPLAWLLRTLGVPERGRSWPERWGVWPAYMGLCAFVWLELVYPTAAHIQLLGLLVFAWVVLTFVAMVRWGVATWLDHGEPFAVYTRVLAHIAPCSSGRWRLPIIGLVALPTPPGMVALVTLLIGSVSYDGLSRTLWWKERVGPATARLVDRGMSVGDAQLLFGSFGLVVMVLLAFGAFALAAEASRIAGRLPRRTAWGSTTQAFVHSLVPIALAYVIAHYVSFVWFQSQRVIALVSDPLGRGWDLFGTAGFDIDYSTLSANAIWATQIVAIVVGHVFGLMLAHDRALEIERDSDRSVNGIRSQLPMLALMILYTVGGLYFLSEGLNV